jgi:hypothetical protein
MGGAPRPSRSLSLAPPPRPARRQADYDAAWRRIVRGLAALADACPGINVSLEWKPTDPAARFSFVPSTGAALLLAQQVRGRAHAARQGFTPRRRAGPRRPAPPGLLQRAHRDPLLLVARFSPRSNPVNTARSTAPTLV